MISKDSGFCFQHFETVFILHYSFLKNDLYLNNVCNVAMLYIMESKNLHINFLIYKFRTPWLFFFLDQAVSIARPGRHGLWAV